MLLRQAAKDKAKQAKDILKLSTIRGLAKAKDATSQELLRIAQAAQEQVQKQKDAEAAELAPVKDKAEKAAIRARYGDAILKIKQDAQRKADEVKDKMEKAKTTSEEMNVIGPQPPPIPSEQQVVKAEAATIVSEAQAKAEIEQDAP